MDSLWTDTVNIRSHKPLEHDIKTSVLIIGGGLTGILCAYRLKRLGIPCVIAEAGEICSKTTRCTTAKITAQHGLIYHKLAKRYSLEYARMYLEAGLTALSEYENMCADIDCDFEHRNNYVYSIDNFDILERELDVLNRIGYRASCTRELPIPLKTAGAVGFNNQAQFNPLKFVHGLINDLEKFETKK